MALPTILDAIGNTPAVWLDRIVQEAGVEGRILAKLDYLNPGFSKKDRAALGIIQNARASGALQPGQAVVELTSGNMGTGLAIVCGRLGHPFVAVMSAGNTVERARMMRALGAEVILVAQAGSSVQGHVSGADLALVEVAAQQVTLERDAFRADQFHHPGNPTAHQVGTAAELWADSDQTLDVFVDFAGSGGTFAGTMTGLRAFNPDICGYIVEPEGAAALCGCAVTKPNHPIQGGGYAMRDLTFLRDLDPCGYVSVDGDDARELTRALALFEGIFAGISTGANLAAALALLSGKEKGKTIGLIVCDSGLKYLSTDLWP